jgi:hypothetical protein
VVVVGLCPAGVVVVVRAVVLLEEEEEEEEEDVTGIKGFVEELEELLSPGVAKPVEVRVDLNHEQRQCFILRKKLT